MRRWMPAMTAALVLTLGLSLAVRANPVAPPPPPQTIQFGQREAKIVVEVDEKAKQPRLVVPMGLIAAQPKPGAGAGRMPAILGGLAMALAFVSGGFWLLRKGPARTLVVLFATSLFCAGLSASVAQADLARPPVTAPVKLPANVKLSGNQITLEVVPRGDSIKLIVPKDAVVEEKPNEK